LSSPKNSNKERRKMKIKKSTVFELYDLDGQKSYTFSRKEAKEAFKNGFVICEGDIVENRITRKRKVITIFVKSW
jgi:hypothetical protein